MKEKNRFSVLLEHLTSMANLKNYTIAKAVQYDESYISKWISGKLLPAEKNHEIIFQNISECIVNSLNPDTISMFLQEYQVRNLQDLKIAKSQPPLQVVVWVGPHKGRLHARPKGRVSQALSLVRL